MINIQKVLFTTVSLYLMFSVALAEIEPQGTERPDRCASFIPADLSQAIAHRELNNLCVIEAGEHVESIKYDKKEFIYNPATKENQLIYYNDLFLALIVDRDLFYIIEEGNEVSRNLARSVIGLTGVGFSTILYFKKGTKGAAAGVLTTQGFLALEEFVYNLDKDYDLGLYSKEEDVKRDKKRDEAPKIKPTRYVYGNDGRLHFQDGTSAPVIIYDPPPKQHDYEESWS